MSTSQGARSLPNAVSLSRCAALILALTIALPACDPATFGSKASAPADSAAGEMAFRFAGPGGAAVVVPVHINGEGPFELILDTGATLTCVDSSLVGELGLPEQRATVGNAVGVGGAGRVRIVAVDSIRVGKASVTGLNACAMDLQALHAVGPEVRGLLGFNVLRRFYVTLDFEREIMSLTSTEND